MILATSKLDQKSASLKATDVIQDIVQQLKLVLEPSPIEK